MLVVNCSFDKFVVLVNKLLCFYLVLVEFCIENFDVVFNQNKDVFEELFIFVNKYFYWLVELGYIVWKRLNFINSLEKILSEICVVFDDVW